MKSRKEVDIYAVIGALTFNNLEREQMSNLLQDDILKCKQRILNIIIGQYDQKKYADKVIQIFDSIFTHHFIQSTCPNKLEPKSDHLPKEGIDRIKRAKGLK